MSTQPEMPTYYVLRTMDADGRRLVDDTSPDELVVGIYPPVHPHLACYGEAIEHAHQVRLTGAWAIVVDGPELRDRIVAHLAEHPVYQGLTLATRRRIVAPLADKLMAS